MRRYVSIALLLFAASVQAQALTPYLIRDLNTGTVGIGSSPKILASLGERALVLLDQGRDLWSSDGTPEGTTLLVRSEGFVEFAVVFPGQRLAYLIEQRSDSRRYWATDGTAAGTYPLTADFLQAPPPTWQGQFLRVAGTDRIFFSAGTPQRGTELWTSDSTAAGTRQIADLLPGAGGSEPHQLTSFRGKVFFAADDGRGISLWSTDGTTNGTRLILDPDPRRRQRFSPQSFQVVGQSLFFLVPTANGWFLWKSDGTASGTRSIAKIAPYRLGPDYSIQTIAHLDRLFLLFDDGSNGREIWTSNGTAAGTRRITDFQGVNDSPLSFSPYQLPGRLLFNANDSVHGTELWTSNGSPGGARLLKDVCPEGCSGVNTPPRLAFGGRLYFTAFTRARGLELWSTDGTEAGTRLFKDFCRGTCGSDPRVLGGPDGRFYVTAGTALGNSRLWRSNGTSAGTVPVTDDSFYSGGDRGVAVGRYFLFNGEDATHGSELWRSEGTIPTTRLVADFTANEPGSSSPREFHPTGSRAVFLANDGLSPIGIWSSDGTAEGTRLLLDGGFEPPLLQFAKSGENLTYFYTSNFRALWRTDGTPLGTFQVSPPELDFYQSGSTLAMLGDRAFFVGLDSAHGEELWTSDGTVAGTHLVAEARPGADSSRARQPRPFLGKILFEATDEILNDQLYVTDGTAAGTKKLGEAYPFLADVFSFSSAGTKVFYPRPDPEDLNEFWATDGTVSGTARLFDSSVQVFRNYPAGNRLLFETFGSTYLGLYVSDGTAAGTRKIADDLTLAYPPTHFDPAAFGNLIAFAAFRGSDPSTTALWVTDGTAAGTRSILSQEGGLPFPWRATPYLGGLLLAGGPNLWFTDGTAEGTAVVLSAAPGVDAPLPVTAGDRAYFSWADLETGLEPWALRPD